MLRILGLDILPDRRNFFYVVLDSEKQEIILKGVLNKGDLIDFIKKNSIEVVAIDNIFELYSNAEEIMQFLEKSGVMLVQITGPMFRQRKLASIAREYGMHSGGKLSPEQSAEIAARLASKEGARIIAFTEATLITIARSRSFGVVGGSHQKQYLRAAEARIKAATRELQGLLDERGIPYDIFIRKGGGGFKSARIIAYESFDKLRSVIKETENDWFQIKVEPIRHSKLLFVGSGSEHFELGRGGRHLIVGVDPGETTGIAILDLNGNVLHVASRRYLGLFELIDEIYKYGQPTIISCDVPKVPHFVKMLATQSGAIVFKPSRVLSIDRKNEIARKAGIKIADSHQRDAYVAAWLAYKHFERKFSKIDALARYIPFIDAESVKIEVVLKNTDIRSAIVSQLSRLFREQYKSEDITSPREAILLRENTVLRERYIQLKEKHEEILKENERLRSELNEKEQKISDLLRELEKAQKEELKKALDDLRLRDHLVQKLYLENEALKSAVSNLESKIAELESKIEILRRLSTRENDEIVVKKIPTLTHQTITEWVQNYGLTRFDFILTHRVLFSSKLLEALKESKVLGIILIDRESTSPETVYTLEANGIAVIDYSDVLELIDKNLLVQKVKIHELRGRIRKILIEQYAAHEHLYQEFLEILEEYRKKRLEHFAQ